MKGDPSFPKLLLMEGLTLSISWTWGKQPTRRGKFKQIIRNKTRFSPGKEDLQLQSDMYSSTMMESLLVDCSHRM